ncbi:hypothetical protein JCM11641_007920 [Rhodosporidiobolus odoratus]
MLPALRRLTIYTERPFVADDTALAFGCLDGLHELRFKANILPIDLGGDDGNNLCLELVELIHLEADVGVVFEEIVELLQEKEPKFPAKEFRLVADDEA